MKNKKGFAIIETLITTVVLTTALISLYVLFNNMMVKEKRRAYYDDPLFIVRSNTVFDVFFEILRNKSSYEGHDEKYVDFNDYLTYTYTDEGVPLKSYIVSFSCDNTVFDNREACQDFFYSMSLYRIYISQFDLSYTHTCEGSNSEKCITYNLLGEQTKAYIKSLPYVPGAQGVYLIFEYYDNGEGAVCTKEDCMRQYASVKYGGSNTVIQLK